MNSKEVSAAKILIAATFLLAVVTSVTVIAYLITN